MKLGMYIMAPELISTAYFTNPSHQSVCMYVYPTTVAKQRIDNNISATNRHELIELSDALFSMRSVSYQKKVGEYFFPEYLFMSDGMLERYQRTFLVLTTGLQSCVIAVTN
jgi:hypothetical protein